MRPSRDSRRPLHRAVGPLAALSQEWGGFLNQPRDPPRLSRVLTREFCSRVALSNGRPTSHARGGCSRGGPLRFLFPASTLGTRALHLRRVTLTQHFRNCCRRRRRVAALGPPARRRTRALSHFPPPSRAGSAVLCSRALRRRAAWRLPLDEFSAPFTNAIGEDKFIIQFQKYLLCSYIKNAVNFFC